MNGLDRIGEARADVRTARTSLETTIRKEIPPGSAVEYLHGDNLICVVVEKLNWDAGRAFVTNGTSGKSYWIGTYSIGTIIRRGP